MKLITRFLSLSALVAAAILYAGCGGGGGDTKSETDTQLEKLNGTWNVVAGNVELDDAAPPFAFTGFKLIINAPAGSTSFSWQGQTRPEKGPWDADGTFTFGSPVTSKLLRDDGVQITYTVTDTSLTMDFTYTGAGYDGSRVSSVEGNWHFEFTKQ